MRILRIVFIDFVVVVVFLASRRGLGRIFYVESIFFIVVVIVLTRAETRAGDGRTELTGWTRRTLVKTTVAEITGLARILAFLTVEPWDVWILGGADMHVN